MPNPALLQVSSATPPGVDVVALLPADRRLVTGLDSGPGTKSGLLGDDLLAVADKTAGPLVIDLLAVDWIDSGACAVIIRFWKELRIRGRTMATAVTPPLRETFRITGLNRLVPSFDTLAEAVAAARGP